MLRLGLYFSPYQYQHLFSHFSLFFFNDTATTEIYTLSLHDALPISRGRRSSSETCCSRSRSRPRSRRPPCRASIRDRKSTRLNSSHLGISYAVFCLKKKQRKVK